MAIPFSIILMNPKDCMYLDVNGQKYPFHIACIPEDRTAQTNVYAARFDVNPQEYISHIHVKKQLDSFLP